MKVGKINANSCVNTNFGLLKENVKRRINNAFEDDNLKDDESLLMKKLNNDKNFIIDYAPKSKFFVFYSVFYSTQMFLYDTQERQNMTKYGILQFLSDTISNMKNDIKNNKKIFDNYSRKNRLTLEDLNSK